MTTKHCKYKRDELEKYCKDKYGYVKCVTQSMHIGLPPWGLTKIKETVRDTVLEEKFGHFDATLGGIVLDIRNITILGDNYPVHNDSSAVHVSLNVNFYVFQPREGVIVKGIIKHIAFHHISVTIHRFFNVSIPMEKKNNNLKIDMEVNVRLTKLDFDDSIPYFEGELELPIGHEKKENSTDSGICTNGTKVKLMKTINGEISSDSDEDSSSESDDDTSSDIDDIDFAKIKVKEEPESSSQSFSSNNSDSEHKSTSLGFNRTTSLTKAAIKRETTSSTSSSTDAEDLIQNEKSVKLSSPPIQLGKRKRRTTRDEIAKIKKEMSFSSYDEIESTKQLIISNKQNGTISPKKKVKKEIPSVLSSEMNSTQSQKVKQIQDESILSVEKVKRKKSSADTPIDETNSSPRRSSTLLEKKHKKKSKERQYESSNEVSSTRRQTVSYIQEEPARNVKKEKSSSNDETNFSPGLSSTLLMKKKKSSREEPCLLSNEINSSWRQKVRNISDEPIVSVKRERSLSSSSDDETNFSSDISSKRKKKPSKVTEYLKGLLKKQK